MSHFHEIRTVRCANCGRLRQEASRWFVLTVRQGKFLCMPLGKASGRTGIHASRNLERRLKSNQQPACGQLCAQRLFERYLAEQAIYRTTRFQAGDDQAIVPTGPAKTKDEHAQ